MTDRPLITLSIVSHGDADRTAQLLTSLQKHESDVSRFQLILTDNLGNDLPDIEPGLWASVHIIRNQQQQSYAHNHNRAFIIAKGEYFAVMNPDLIFEKPVFDDLVARLNTTQAHLIAPYIVDKDRKFQDSFRPLPSPAGLLRRRISGYRFDPPKPDNYGLIRPDWVAAMFWLMPADTYQILRGMDEKFTLYFEDVDFCTRARLKGLEILVDTKIQVRHDAQRSSRRSLYYLYLHTKSAIRFFNSQVYKQARRKR